MYMKWVALLSLILAAGAVLAARLAVRRLNRQMAEMADALQEIKSGNGNRRLLYEEHAPAAPLAYLINETVVSYENRLAALRQTEETHRQLMTSLSHDIRTPLATLIGYLDAVHKGTVTGQEKDGYIEIARQKAHHLQSYLDVLFDWCRLNSNEFALSVGRAEAAEMTRDILIDWIPVFESRQIGYCIDIPEQPFWVRLDPDAYLRICNNLLQNAVDHSQAHVIRLSLSRQDGSMMLRIEDDGVGIPREELGRIFERLYQCGRGYPEKGSGLGLAIVRQLAEKMGGAVTADSAPGQGMAFTLLFPLAD